MSNKATLTSGLAFPVNEGVDSFVMPSYEYLPESLDATNWGAEDWPTPWTKTSTKSSLELELSFPALSVATA